jgi:hypothetical protein
MHKLYAMRGGAAVEARAGDYEGKGAGFRGGTQILAKIFAKSQRRGFLAAPFDV